MLLFLSLSLFTASGWIAYVLWLRPVLRQRPSLKYLYAHSDSFWAAVKSKFLFIKTQVAAALLKVASVLIAIHDFLVPVATGIDWTPATQKIPDWIWPFLLFGIGATLLWLRNATSREQALVSQVREG